ncbi:MAG: hypothetical protein KA110_11635 [Acidimicrobiia bacterium]|nr:hypothetical protein [Acidimicrobiia bacterium]
MGVILPDMNPNRESQPDAKNNTHLVQRCGNFDGDAVAGRLPLRSLAGHAVRAEIERITLMTGSCTS